ncbi:MAG TPA: sialidase family protein, partial [Thermoanaerobaculia bacterium]|nr:sialidase family protein [Thermoanaerobaculia bacterium]
EIPGVEPPIAAAPDEPGTVYAWDPAARRIAKSTDGARTFRLTGAIALKPADEILALHATYGRPASVFASFRGSFSAGGLYRSGDGGGHWNRVAFVQSGALDVTSEPGNPRRILALRRDGISASDQAGRGGTFRPLVFFSPAEIAADPFSLAAVLGGPYLSAGGDLFRPVSSSRSERVSERGIEAFGVSALAFHPLDPSHVALETFHGCIRDFCDGRTDLSVDGGATWTRLGLQNAPADFIDARAFAFDPASVARFAAILGGHVVLWQPAGGGDVLSASVTSLAFADGGALLAGGRIGIVRSTDSGATWQTTLEPAIPPTPEHPAGGERNVVRLQASPYDPDRLFAFAFDYAQHNPRLPPGNPAIYRTADGGLTWSKLLDGTGDVEFVPGAPSSLYFLTGTELLRSDDDGAIFVVLHTFPLPQRVSGFAIDPAAPQDLYAASASGLLRSRDGGETWAPAPSAIAPWGAFRRALGKVWVDPAERGHVFAAPSAGGLFEEN